MSYYESPSDLSGKSFGYGSLESGRPRLRSDLILRHQQYGPDELFYVVKDPITKDYFKLTPLQWDLYALFDGNHTEEEIIEEYNAKYPLENINEDVIETTKQDLKSAGLLDVSSTEKNLMLMERIRSERKLRLGSQDKWTFEYMILWSFDPDKLLDRLIPRIRFLWTRWFFFVSLTAILLMLVINVVRWNEFWQGTLAIYSFRDYTFWDVLVFIFLMTVPLSIHEFGHALTMKHYGGECHQVGFMLFYLSPAFFAEAADAYLLEKRSERIWFSLAGIYSEALLCCLAAFIWFFTPPGTAIHDFAFLLFLFSGITSLLLNLNPLVRLDGYYILADLIGIDDLREQSLSFIGRWIRGNFFHLQVEQPAVALSKRKRRIFLTYGILTLLYTFSLYFFIVLWIKNIYFEIFGQIGFVLFLITLGYLFRKKIREGLSFLKVLYLDKKEVLMKRRTTAILVSLGLVALLLIPKSHIKISSPFVVEPIERSEIRFENDGFIDSILVRENDHVHKGQILARLRNPELSDNVFRLNSRLTGLDRELSALSSGGNMSDYRMKLRSREQSLREKTEAERKVGALLLRTPIDGSIITPRLDEKIGIFANKGDPFCIVANLEKVKIVIPVGEYGIDDVQVGQKVVLKMNAYPTETFHGQVEKISPAMTERVESIEGAFARFNVLVVIDNKNRKLFSGMEGDAKILAARYSFAGRMVRELIRGIRSGVW